MVVRATLGVYTVTDSTKVAQAQVESDSGSDLTSLDLPGLDLRRIEMRSRRQARKDRLQVGDGVPLGLIRIGARKLRKFAGVATGFTLSTAILSSTVLPATVLLATVLEATPAMAAYRKPQDARPPSTATSTSGARTGGGVDQSGLRLTPLAPQQHVGRSMNAYPTFTWFVPEGAALLGEFQLYEVLDADGLEVDSLEVESLEVENLEAAGLGSASSGGESFDRMMVYPYEFESRPGFMTFTWPADMPGLEPGKSYIWQVLLRYGERPSEIVKVRSQIDIVDAADIPSPLSLDLTTQISQLAEAGLWYDALSLTAELPVAESYAKREELLVALADVEVEHSEVSADISVEADQDRSLSSHAQALRQIADWEEDERLSSLLMRLKR